MATFLSSSFPRALGYGGGVLLVAGAVWWGFSHYPADPTATPPTAPTRHTMPGLIVHKPKTGATPALGPVTPSVTTKLSSSGKKSPARTVSYVDTPALSLSAALDLRVAVGLPARLGAVRMLGHEMSREEWGKLRDFLVQPAADSQLNPAQLLYLKNEAMNALARSEAWRDDTVGCLKAIQLDPNQDPALRDYALQFIAAAVERSPHIGWDLHWRTVEGENKDLAATAALHLFGAARRGDLSESDTRRLGVAALQILDDPSQPPTNRASALSVCGGLGVEEARPLARQLSENESAPFIARIAAIAALGDLGDDQETRDYLQSLSTAHDIRLRLPATSALARYRLTDG